MFKTKTETKAAITKDCVLHSGPKLVLIYCDQWQLAGYYSVCSISMWLQYNSSWMNHRPHEGIVCTESYHVLFSVAFSKDFDIYILYSCHKCTAKGENGSLMCTLKAEHVILCTLFVPENINFSLSCIFFMKDKTPRNYIYS